MSRTATESARRRDEDPARARPGRGRVERGHRGRLPRPHARPARPPRAARPEGGGEGDLETGAHHTIEDVGIVLGQAIDQALGDRAGIRRYGSATVPMDEALGECAIDISGRPLLRVRGRAAAASIAGFDAELAEEFFRAVANNAKLTLHSGPLRVERPPHGRGLLQGLRARPARCGLGRSRRDRRALDQGDAERVSPASRSSTTGWATCARWRRRSSASAPRGISRDPTVRACDGVILPGVGAFPKAMERSASSGSTS